jgi:hypothetical protein
MSVCQQRDLATKKGVETLPRRVKNLPHNNIRCSRALRMGLMAHFYFIWTIKKTQPAGIDGRLRAGRDSKFPDDVLDVLLHGGEANEQAVGNLAVAVALCQEP